MANINANQAAFDLLTGVTLTEAQKTELQLALGDNHSVLEASTVGAGAPNILTAEESLSTFTNKGTSVLNYHTLPAAQAGVRYTFVCDDSNGIRITAAAGDRIRMGAAVSALGGFVESQFFGAYVTLLATDDAQWVAIAGDPTYWKMDNLYTGTGSHGEAFFSTPGTTTLAAATPAKAAGATTGWHLHGFTHTDNRLTYQGITEHFFRVRATTTVTKSDAGSTVAHIYVAVNGSVQPGLQISQSMSGSTDKVAMSLSGTIELGTNDYVELWVSTDDGDDLTVQLGNINLTDAGPAL